MNSRLTNYLQLGANIGILAGLILVGLQIRDANRATTAQLGFDAWNGAMDTHEIMMGEDLATSWTKAQMNADDLNERDIVIIDAYLNREWLNNARVSRASIHGYDLETMELTIDKWIYSILGNETAIDWWNAGREFRKDSNPNLHAAITKRLEELGPQHKNFHGQRLRQRLSGK